MLKIRFLSDLFNSYNGLNIVRYSFLATCTHYLLKAELCYINLSFDFYEPSSNYPVISLRQLNEKNPLKVANITIRADGKEVVSDIVGLPQAVCCLIGTYYLLDISFPPNLKKTLSFIQCCICNLEPMEKAPIAVSRLQNELVRKK